MRGCWAGTPGLLGEEGQIALPGPHFKLPVTTPRMEQHPLSLRPAPPSLDLEEALQGSLLHKLKPVRQSNLLIGLVVFSIQ